MKFVRSVCQPKFAQVFLYVVWLKPIRSLATPILRTLCQKVNYCYWASDDPFVQQLITQYTDCYVLHSAYR